METIQISKKTYQLLLKTKPKDMPEKDWTEIVINTELEWYKVYGLKKRSC